MVRLEPLYFIGPVTEVQGGSVYPHDPGENLELPPLADGQDCQPWGCYSDSQMQALEDWPARAW